MAEAKRTHNHEEIRKWVEEHDGHPSVVESTHDKEGSGLLRIDFGKPEKSLEEIDWDEFFKIFDDNDLDFLYQDGSNNKFFKFVSRE